MPHGYYWAIYSFSSGGKIIQKKNPTQCMTRAHGLGLATSKSENQIIVRSIKLEKPFQSLLTFSRSVGEKNILLSVLLSFFLCLFPQCPPK